jgi:hypothetical protein
LGEPDNDEDDDDSRLFSRNGKVRTGPSVIRTPRKKFDKLRRNEAMEEAYFNARRAAVRYANELWHFYYKDDCPIHLALKTKNEWFPHKDYGTTSLKQKETKDQESLTMMKQEIPKKDEIVQRIEEYVRLWTYQYGWRENGTALSTYYKPGSPL